MSQKMLPTDDKLWMILAESARPEAAGKMMLLGYFGGERIKITNSPPTAMMITILFVLRDGVGTFDGKLFVYAPNGNLLSSIDLPQIVKPNQVDNHITVASLQPMPLPELGDYRVVFQLDQNKYERKISILR